MNMKKVEIKKKKLTCIFSSRKRNQTPFSVFIAIYNETVYI